MFSRMFGMFAALGRGLAKSFVAFVIALVLGGSLSTALGFIQPDAIALMGTIFLLVLTALSRRSGRFKTTAAVGLLAVWGIVKMMSPGIERLENAVGAEINHKALHYSYALEMPKRVDCTEPFLDPRSKEPVKFFRMQGASAECFDRSGIVEGEDLRPVTREVAYLVSRQRPAPQPQPVIVVAEPAPQPQIVVVPTPAPVQVAVQQPGPKLFGSVPCDRDEETRRLCRDLRVREQRARDRLLR